MCYTNRWHIEIFCFYTCLDLFNRSIEQQRINQNQRRRNLTREQGLPPCAMHEFLGEASSSSSSGLKGRKFQEFSST